jgi:hypothetical protein
MYRRSFLVALKLMRLILVGNGKTNISQFVITVQNEEDEPRNNRYLESFVGTATSGLKLLMTLKLKRSNNVSQEKY